MINKKQICGIKVVFIGDSDVGKNDIISMETKSPGSDFITKTIQIDQNTFINFDIWDTAGLEKYRALTKFFYKDAGVFIMVYDITRKSSFDNLKYFWIEQIKINSGGNAGKYINI